MAFSGFTTLAMAFIFYAVSNADGAVRPRKFSLFVDMSKTWDSAHQVCCDVNMSLATLDPTANQFLRSSAATLVYRKNVKDHFWIGLHKSDVTDASSSNGNVYRWTGNCQPLTSGAAWDLQEPRASSDRTCVYATNDTTKWRTDACNASHSLICERQSDACFYNQTDFRLCASFSVTSEKVLPVQRGVEECQDLCESSLLAGRPCWGFERNGSQCVLYHDYWQPQCDVSSTSAMYFRTCFQVFYMHGSSAKQLFGTGRAPDSLCDVKTQPTAPDTSVTTTSESRSNTFSEASGTERPIAPLTAFKPSLGVTGSTPADVEITTSPDARTTSGHQATTEPDKHPEDTTSNTDGLTSSLANAPAAKPTDPEMVPPSRLSADTPRCPCRCPALRHVQLTSLLHAAAKATQALVVNKEALSSTRRRRMSASDPRPSAQRIGWVGIGFVVTAAIFVVLMDVTNFLRYLCFRETQRKAHALATTSGHA